MKLGRFERRTGEYVDALTPNLCSLSSLFGGQQDVTQKSAPWGPQQQYLKEGFAQAENLFKNYTPQYYSGSTVAPFNDAQQQALTGIENTAQNNPFTQNAMNFGNALESGQYLNSNPGMGYFSNLVDPNNTQNQALSDYASGKYLNNNPYQDQQAQSILSQVLPQVTSGFVNGNSLGNPSAAYAAAQGATSALAPIEYSNYQQQQQNQLNAAGQLNSNLATAGSGAGGLYGQAMQQMLGGLGIAPQTQGLAYGDLNQLFGAGQQQQNQSQQELNDQVNRFNYYQQLPYNQLNQFQSEIGGNYGGQFTTPYYTNPLSATMGTLGGLGTLGQGLGLSTAGGLGGFGDMMGSLLAFL